MKIDFIGKVVLITGATRGIGKQIADDCERLGAELILTGTKIDEIRKLNLQEKKTTGQDVKKKYYCVDFTRPESMESFLQVLKNQKKIDVCINNAGINRINYIDETRLKDIEEIIEVNLKAPFLIMREVSRCMKKNRYGRIVNISSIFGVISREKRSVYSTTKFGLRGMTVAAANELAKYNVLVNAVSPGFVLTELTKSILSNEEMEDLSRQIPARRMATPDEISKTVLFLASSLNTYITGQNIIVDGGFVNV